MKSILKSLLIYLAWYAASAVALWTTPIELLRRAFLKGPMMFDIRSSPDQFAGRTTLSSGSATVTVSTRQVNSDSLLKTFIEAALPAAYTTQGTISVVSGGTTGTASTTAVYSGQIVDFTVLNNTSQLSGVGRGFRINSVVDGVSFAATTDDGQGITAGTAVLGWRIEEAIPQGLKVNTIGVGFFTMGWADGRARPVDSTVHWEVRKSS